MFKMCYFRSWVLPNSTMFALLDMGQQGKYPGFVVEARRVMETLLWLVARCVEYLSYVTGHGKVKEHPGFVRVALLAPQ